MEGNRIRKKVLYEFGNEAERETKKEIAR